MGPKLPFNDFNCIKKLSHFPNYSSENVSGYAFQSQTQKRHFHWINYFGEEILVCLLVANLVLNKLHVLNKLSIHISELIIGRSIYIILPLLYNPSGLD